MSRILVLFAGFGTIVWQPSASASPRFKRQTGFFVDPSSNNNAPTFFDSLVNGDGQPPPRVRFATNPFQQFPQGPYLYDPFGFERARLYENQRQALIDRLHQQELQRQQQPQQQIFVPPSQSTPILIPQSQADPTALQPLRVGGDSALQPLRVGGDAASQDAEAESLLSSVDFKTADPKVVAAYLKANPQVVQSLNAYWERKLSQGRSPDESLTLGQAARLLQG